MTADVVSELSRVLTIPMLLAGIALIAVGAIFIGLYAVARIDRRDAEINPYTGSAVPKIITAAVNFILLLGIVFCAIFMVTGGI